MDAVSSVWYHVCKADMESSAPCRTENGGGVPLKGVVYGVGVGPGDPELMTLKAIHLIQGNRVIAVPGGSIARSVAYKTAVAAVPELADKELIALTTPMVRDRTIMDHALKEGAARIERYLDAGENVVCLTLGDPTVYSTFTYLQRILEADGYLVELVSGVTSFCAAAARLGIPLAAWDETLHIVPAGHHAEEPLTAPGSYVLMKTGGHMETIKQRLRESGREVLAVENCGMDAERIFRGVDDIPDDAGYFSLIIARDP